MKKLVFPALLFAAIGASAQTVPTSPTTPTTLPATSTSTAQATANSSDLPSDAQAVLKRFFDATGGEGAWDSVSTYTMTQSFVANAPTDYEMEVTVSPDANKIARRKTIMKRDFYYAVNGNQSWLKIPMGSMDKNVKYTVKDLSTEETNAMKQEMGDGILPLLDYSSKGFKASFKPYKTYGTKSLAQITLSRGNETIDYYFDKDSGMLVKEVYTTPQLTETWEHTKYAKTNSGLVYPSESTYIDSKANRKTTVKTTLVVNEPVDAALFIKN